MVHTPPKPESATDTPKESFHTAMLHAWGNMSIKELIFSWGVVSLSFIILMALYVITNGATIGKVISPIIATLSPLRPIREVTKGHEVFGFAPYWTLNKLENVDFSTLTTLAYFGLPIDEDGNVVKDDIGYERFHSERATALFQKAHDNGTRVVLTLTIMDNDTIVAFLESPEAQKRSIEQAIAEVKNRGIDGINVDIEYLGDPGTKNRARFSTYVKNITEETHRLIPDSYVTVSVYASSVKAKKLYNIASLGRSADAVFMMAYDFATSGSDSVIPTSPLYGYKEGKYWYDVSTAVEDFLTVMPSEKLILGLPWYGYNYPVSEPVVKAAKYEGYSYYYWENYRRKLAHFRPTANAQTYAAVHEDVVSELTGWDDVGKVGWRAYQTDGIWRMIFLDDEKSLQLKYQFAKEKNLAGVGMWALGFDDGRTELWDLLKLEFGEKLAATSGSNRRIEGGVR